VYIQIPACTLICVSYNNDLYRCLTDEIMSTHCNALQHTATQIALQRTATHCNTLQQNFRCLTDKTISAHCNTLQHTATHYDAQHTATHCNRIIDAKPTRQYIISLERDFAFFRTLVSVCYNIAFFYRCLNDETISTHCSALQHTAKHYNRIIDALPTRLYQHTATHCNTLQHTATHYNRIIDALPTRLYLIWR